ALAYSAIWTAADNAHLHDVYTCTFAILFFGTPHNGSSKARLLGSLQKLTSLAFPKGIVDFESGLLTALEEESETFQNITDQFAPLMDYIVDEASAAPMLDNTERYGIASDHRVICKFDTNTSQGFRIIASALRRYIEEAPQVIQGRWQKMTETRRESRRHEAIEILRAITFSQDLDDMPAFLRIDECETNQMV
ncbi:hypothetical protein DPV78_004779, partial [Talaromyces pinophilus]